MNNRPDVRPRVWVVDDSNLDAERARLALDPDFDVVVFGDGSTVLEALGDGDTPDVLVLDWVMPAVSGLEVVQFIRASDGPMSLVQVLLLTARGAPEQIVEGLNAGANDYLAKPYAPVELRARVRALLRSASLLARAQAAEAAITTVVASSPDPMLAIDADGAIGFANDEARRILGEGPLLGRRIADLLPDLAERLLGVAGASSDTTIGSRVYAPSTRTVPGSSAVRTIVTLRDVTDRRRMDQRRLDFYSIIAHDLRSPLQSTMLRTAMMREGGRGELPPAARDELGKLDVNLRSMIGLINDFLDMARTEAQVHTLRMEAVDLGELIAGVIEGLEALASSKAQRVEWSRPDRMMVLADRRGLAQVIGNLLGNALKFSPKGGRVRVAIEPRGDRVRTAITDEGPGIPLDEQPTLFERFTRGARQQTEAGTGLGLMIVHQVIEAHGGAVGVESEVGKGSCFWFELASAPS